MDGYIWACFYSSVCAMYLHPGRKTDLDVVYCALLADRMFAEYKERFLCPG